MSYYYYAKSFILYYHSFLYKSITMTVVSILFEIFYQMHSGKTNIRRSTKHVLDRKVCIHSIYERILICYSMTSYPNILSTLKQLNIIHSTQNTFNCKSNFIETDKILMLKKSTLVSRRKIHEYQFKR